jgi:hypothetical protein
MMSKADIKIINNNRLQILNEEEVVVCEGKLYTPEMTEQLLELVINLGYEVKEIEKEVSK